MKNWITINEPHSYASCGYADGTFPPGRGKDGVGDPGTEPYIVAKNLLLSHASVVNLYRQKFQVIYISYSSWLLFLVVYMYFLCGLRVFFIFPIEESDDIYG